MVQIAVMGYGVVGSGVVEVLTTHTDHIAKRAKEEIGIKYILDLREFPDSLLRINLQSPLTTLSTTQKSVWWWK